MMTMDRKGGAGSTHRATIGFAVDENGFGVAYVRLVASGGAERSARIEFSCRPAPALRGRDAAYSALTAVAREVRRRGIRAVTFEIDDEQLVADLRDRRQLPRALSMAYVTLGCELNRFTRSAVEVAPPDEARDLTARARADVLFHVAA